MQTTTIKVNPTKKLSEYNIPNNNQPTPQQNSQKIILALPTWWHLDNNNRKLPTILKGEHKGWLPCQITKETNKAIHITINQHNNQTTTRWIAKSIILALEAA